MAIAAAVLGAVVSVAGVVQSAKANRDLTKSQKEASEAQEKQQILGTRRSRRQAIRQAQAARAQVVASSVASGASGSSSAQGGMSSIGSQLGGGLGFSSAMSGLSGDINSANQSGMNARQAMGVGRTMQGLGGSLYQFGVNQGFQVSDLAPNRAPIPTAPWYEQPY